MFISTEQLERSVLKLSELHPFFGTAYLAFKQNDLPIGKTAVVRQSRVCEEVLQEFYRVTDRYEGFYNPFYSSKPEERWVKPRYGSTTLQRICTDTFGDAFIHDRGSSQWGWKKNYVGILKRHLAGQLIPAFDLAVWLYRDRRWPKGTTSKSICNEFFESFNITADEKKRLFETGRTYRSWFQLTPVLESDVLNIVGWPPGTPPPGGALLRHLDVRAVGPAEHFSYHPADRLNIITGDNSLGKTFLLDVIWWALSDNWCNYPAFPHRRAVRKKASIEFEVSTGPKKTRTVTAQFDWSKNTWVTRAKREAVAGLVIYARHDGSFGIWDPARVELVTSENAGPKQIVLSSTNVWRGLRQSGASDREQTLCNGLISDWTTWQIGGKRYKSEFEALTSSLAALSPSSDEPIVPGDPHRFPLESQECPTIRMSYGDVPIVLASAGVQRAIALAYVLVWAWHEHLRYSAATKNEPHRRLVLMVDEVEAHLHPKWQRTIVPALLDVAAFLSEGVNPQLHLATHSPLVLASAETSFDIQSDCLHHLRIEKDSVTLEAVDFVKHGRVDRWLISDIFGLGHARSITAERTIEEAMNLQLAKNPSSKRVENVHERLIRCLADDDDFWPRWLYFAEQHGVDT